MNNNNQRFNSDGTYRFGGAGNPVPNQNDNANRTYNQQYIPKSSQPNCNNSYNNYGGQSNSNSKKSSFNLPTVIVSVAAASIIGFSGGMLGSKMGGGNETVIKSNDGTKVVFQAVEHTSADSSKNTISDVASAVKSSVVEITTEVVSTNRLMGQYISEGAGSGVIVTVDGYIVTNHHVIDGANSIKVTLNNGQSYAAKIIGDDAQTDLAVLKIDVSGLTPAIFGNSDNLTVGQTAIAIGNPLGQLGGTVTSGIVSALDREVEIDGQTMTLLQTSAAINPGNSGGGLFDDNGNLIGVVNAKSSGSDIEGLGFAIPCNTVKSIISDLMQYGYVKGRVSLGISVVDISNAQTAWMYRVSETGLYISKVQSGSDAQKAGLQVGDKITSFNGAEINSEADFSKAIKSCTVGSTVTITIRRNGMDYEVNITLSESKG